jgi:nitrous oxide reductase accessory protein NosL
MGYKAATRAIIFLILLSSVPVLWASDTAPAKPGPKDKCPVCGMFVKKYPDWVAQVVFKDGTHAFFDGAKDLFKYCLNLKKYSPAHTQADIEAVYATDYYRLEPVDAYTAHYVAGSDVYGPMGRELIPFEKAEDAKEFMKDHRGKTIVRFRDVTPELLKTLD